MKILKIILILLIPAMGIVGCEKDDSKPDGCQKQSQPAEPATDGSGAKGAELTPTNTDQSGNVVASGDDDRDGGDKKKKSTSK